MFSFFGDSNLRYLKKLEFLVKKINSLETEFEKLSSDKLREKTENFKKFLKNGESLEDILPEAFALVREAAKRTLNQRHYDVQLLGGIVLHQGKITEMRTGEGKTLTATLAVYLNALLEKGVHIITVNDYLAKRDTVWMGQIYHLLGLSVGCIVNEAAYIYDPSYRHQEKKDKERDIVGGFKVVESYLRPCSRKESYLADITYGTNNEFGFDYLRDNLAMAAEQQTQRSFYYAIVDEIDSILIDEARTPLIISEPDYESPKWYKEFSRIIPKLKENLDYNLDEKMKVATLTEAGIEKIEKILAVANIYDSKGMKYLHYLEQSLRAYAFFHRDKDYIVKDGKIIIVDEFTGRLLFGRRYSEGLHQAIEAKEKVEVQPESKTMASITFQNYFRMYKKLSGMTGTAATSAEEFEKVYNLETIIIPTAKPMIRTDLPDKVFKTKKEKFKAIVEEVKKRHKTGQPILIGTTSIETNEYLAKLLELEGIYSQVLNAKHHEKEGQIIAQTGKLNAVTVATNMAGRGVDIILGGNPPDLKETEEVKKNGGLFVLGTEKHEALRIDNQLRGRTGRQGDSGSSQFFISLEDDLLRIFGGEKMSSILDILKIPENIPIESKLLTKAITNAQKRVETANFDLRKYVLEYDDVINKQRNKIYLERNEILKKDYIQLKEEILKILKDEIQFIIGNHKTETGRLDCEEIFEETKTLFPLPEEVHFKIRDLGDDDEKIYSYLENLAGNIFSKKEELEGKENMEKILRFVYLKTIDLFWSEHLENMDYLKEAVRLRSYGGRDPLVEYKNESYKIFQELLFKINSQISRTFFKLSIKVEK